MYSFYMFNSLSLVTAKWYMLLQSVQSPHWKTILSVETTKLSISKSLRVYTDTIIDTLSQGWGFWPPVNFVPRWGFLCTMIIPGEMFLLPSSRAQCLLGGGGEGEGGKLDEIDTCICHRHVKSDIARPMSVDQVNHASLQMCRTFSITKEKHSHRKTTFRRIGMSI